MKQIKHFCTAIAVLLCASCSERHFIDDEAYRTMVDSLFYARQQTDSMTYAFTADSLQLTTEEYEAMKFLYAFMPVNDVADYNMPFFLANVRSAITARNEMPWGKDIPNDIFRHFVLPVRVNNENMDGSRMIFYDELKPRIRNLSMHDAALEINHWCHEKVTYAPSDSRTSAPLASILSATGRCGEESVFAVAAMRSAGIPARQVYTPRWAHTDDNHAWIEVWIDGEWHYMGACEPEPELDIAWFDAPVKRAMLLHTKVFGKYQSADEIIAQTPCYTEINVTKNYATVKQIHVQVTDTKGMPIENAAVDFRLYNYAEFYPIATKITDTYGRTSISTGLGDLIIWASKDNCYGFQHSGTGKNDSITVIINRKKGDFGDFEFTVTPPIERHVQTNVSTEQRKANVIRFQYEDSVRKQYENTFYTEQQAATLAKELNYDVAEAWKYMNACRGNHAEIEKFLRSAAFEHHDMAMALLGSISQKDLRDTPAETLLHHLYHAVRYEKNFPDRELFIRYVLNPRIANEMLSCYRNAFTVDTALLQQLHNNPSEALTWFRNNFKTDNTYNPQQIPTSIKGFAELKTGDGYSADIAAIGFLRSLGIAARIEPNTYKRQYFYDNRWHDFNLHNAAANEQHEQGKLLLTFTPDETLKNPQYEIHYTIARFENGKFVTLGLDNNNMFSGEKNILNKSIAINTGYYMLTSGRRLANGSALCRLVFFTVEKDKTTNVPLIINNNTDEVQVLGNINTEAKFTPQHASEAISIIQATGRGYFVLALLEANREPVNHALHELRAAAAEYEKWGRPMIFIFPDEKQLQMFNVDEFKNLPSGIVFGYDNEIASMLKTSLELKSDNLPLFIIADSFGRTVFISQGYRIGLAEQLMNVIRKL
ncbi:MAG: transglutaminase-like domain-containing protein [Prevotellaceae bacterium]|jgi:transglutaminase-like putative cysteine protease|nr:transglutaminase-like domain-containing protein [Prevotellaceae bacterium]